MSMEPPESPAELIRMEIGIAGPIRRQEALGHFDLEPAGEIPGDLVLVELVPARREVEVIGPEGAELGADEQRGIGGAGHERAPRSTPIARPAGASFE